MTLNLITSLNCNQNLNLNCNKNRNSNGNRVRQRKSRCSGDFKNWSRGNFPQRSAAIERKRQAGNRIRGEGARRVSAPPLPVKAGRSRAWATPRHSGLSNMR